MRQIPELIFSVGLVSVRHHILVLLVSSNYGNKDGERTETPKWFVSEKQRALHSQKHTSLERERDDCNVYAGSWRGSVRNNDSVVRVTSRERDKKRKQKKIKKRGPVFPVPLAVLE